MRLSQDIGDPTYRQMAQVLPYIMPVPQQDFFKFTNEPFILEDESLYQTSLIHNSLDEEITPEPLLETSSEVPSESNHPPEQDHVPDPTQKPANLSKYRNNYKRDIAHCFITSLQHPERQAVIDEEKRILDGRLTSKVSYNEVQFSYIVMACESERLNLVTAFSNSESALINTANSQNWSEEKLKCYLWMFLRCAESIQRIGDLSVEDRTLVNIKKVWRKQ